MLPCWYAAGVIFTMKIEKQMTKMMAQKFHPKGDMNMCIKYHNNGCWLLTENPKCQHAGGANVS